MNKRAALAVVLSVETVAAVSCGQANPNGPASSFDPVARACSRFTAIAEDPQKMAYVKMWATARMKDPQFMQEVRRYPWFEGRDARKKKYIDLDWKYLGFDPDYSRIEFNINAKDVRDADATKIGSISLNQTRTSIIIRLNGSTDMALGWSAEEMRELKAVGDGVFVYCYR